MPTLASDIISRAYRECQIIPLVSSPNTNEQNEALPLLNEQLLSALGFEAGSELHDLNIGGAFDQSAYCSTWIPANVRLTLNLAAATTLKLHPHPYEGQRLAVADAAVNLSTNNLTLDGYGRQIEGSPVLVMSSDGDSRQWLYRADTANWVKITALGLSDSLPLPQEFDSFFTTRLAMRLSPRYGAAITKETAAELAAIQGKLRARYRKPRPRQDMPHGFVAGRAFGLSQSDFDAGRTWR